MKNIIAAFFILLSMQSYSQPIVNEWTTQVHLIPNEVHAQQEKVECFFSDEDLGPGVYFKQFDHSGDSISSTQILGLDYCGVSAYSPTQKSYYIGGYDDGLDTMFFSRTDSLGNVVWHKSFGPSGYESSGIYKIITLDSSVIFTCSFFTYLSSSVKTATCYYKLGIDGTLIYQSAIQLLPQTEDFYISYDAVMDDAGDIYIGSTNFEKSRMTKFNGSNGQILWSKNYNQLDIQSLAIGSNNEIIASGGDNLLSKIDNNGNLIYSQTLGDASVHLSEQLFLRQNKIYTIGRYTPDGLPFGGAYVGAYDFETGERLWGWYFDEHSSNGSAYALLAGDFLNDSTLFVKGVGSFPSTSYAYFLAKLRLSGVSSTQYPELGMPIPFNIYPNPTTNGVINLSLNRDEGSIRVMDINGKLISNFDVDERNTIKLPSLGVYVVEYSNTKEHFVQKIIYNK